MAFQASVNVFFELPDVPGERSADFTVESEGPITRALLEQEVFAFVQSLIEVPGYEIKGRPVGELTYTYEVESVFEI